MPDVYANQGYVRITPTLNTLSFEELATFVSVFEKKAFLINRVEYAIAMGSLQEMDAETDSVQFGLSTSDTFTSATQGERSIIDFNVLVAILQAAGVSGHIFHSPVIKDLSTLPGGGVLVPSRPIYLYIESAGWAAAGSMSARIFFTVKDLKADEYWELVESTRLLGA